MTILGNGEGLVDVDVPTGDWTSTPHGQERGERLIQTFFDELDSDTIEFDTSTDTVTFHHRNKAANRHHGIDIAKRTLANWVSLRFFETGVPEIDYDLAEMVINGLNQKARDRLSAPVE